VIRHCKDAIFTCTNDKLDLTRDGRDQRLTVESLGEGRAARKLQVETNGGRTREITHDLPTKCLGVVADFGWIEIGEGFAPAVAALAGADLSALVFQSQRDALEWEQLGESVANDPLKGIRFVALDSCKDAGVEQRLRVDLASTNVQGKVEFALDIIKYDEQATPGIGNLWQQVLGSALIFDRQEDLISYQERFGNGQILVSRHPGGGWKLGGRVIDRRGATAANEVVHFVAPQTTLRYRNFEARILELEDTTRFGVQG
jgi:chromosome segregation ATPase